MSNWRDTSVKIILVLFCVSILLFAFSFVNHPTFSGKTLAEAYGFPIGQSVYEGDSILGADGEVMEVPLISNFNFLIHQITSLDLSGMMISLTTGAVPFDMTSVSSGNIDGYGRATGFDGPGYLTYDGDNLAIHKPDTYIWGYSVPSKTLVKNDDGVDVVVNHTVIEHVPVEKIKDQNWTSDFFNITTIQNWYNDEAKNGSTFVIEKGISNFSDGRADVLADQVYDIFGKNVSDYVAAYPVGTPIVLYMGNTTDKSGEVYSTTLGSHPEYGDTVREYNARQFVDAWNNTIIPPHSSGNGKAYIDFGSASDSNAPGGSASHGVCPPARALRGAVLAEGFSLPVGMVNDEDAVLFGYNPAEDIKVTNTYDVPIKIIMWTEGEGPSMYIYAKIVKLEPAK
ncbi:MAG: hypothetical protein Q4P18_06795 [Methanobrevibacter sp.]|uniref:hypothetical protein n=1 Tax=Methanobrevibacter sp. TaxID=66852 RepID=UPI0026DFBC9D|nr:hypothetical protein [Methanobrevibacter sp.]MDO5849224.1 hypothetical protein [Methanobrevibacter sp.]